MGRYRLRLLALSVTCLVVYFIANINTIACQNILRGVEPLETCGRRLAYYDEHPRARRTRGQKGSSSSIHLLDGDLLDHNRNVREFPPEHRHSRQFPIRSNGHRPKQAGHVAGGSIAEVGQFPSYVGLSKTPYWIDLHCGGTLIGPRLVVSAAHCIMPLEFGGPLYVIVGLNSPKKRELNAYKVLSQCNSPRFCQSHPTWEVLHYDFLLLELEINVRYTDYIQPACMHPVANETNSTFEMAGMGNFGKNSRPETLLYSFQKRGCPDREWRSFSQSSSIVDCYLGTDFTHACPGDSGGPMYTTGRVGIEYRQFVVGALSFGSDVDCMLRPVSGSFFTSFANVTQEMIGAQERCSTNLTELSVIRGGIRICEGAG